MDPKFSYDLIVVIVHGEAPSHLFPNRVTQISFFLYSKKNNNNNLKQRYSQTIQAKDTDGIPIFFTSFS